MEFMLGLLRDIIIGIAGLVVLALTLKDKM